jgi:2C-methyl-D-erythritol 2,4-cyclodiphosphate synthase
MDVGEHWKLAAMQWTANDDAKLELELEAWIKDTPPLVLLNLYKILNAAGYRIGNVDYQIRVEKAKLRRGNP